MDYQIILSLPALRDLGEIARYIAQDNPDAAERVGLALVEMAESLKTLPRRGAVFRARPDSRRLIRAPYLLVYRIDEARHIVYVQRFWHAKRNPEFWRPE